MGWFWGSKTTKLTDDEMTRLNRKCRSLQLALDNCRKANVGEPVPCKNLETSLTACYASDYAKEPYEEHKRCYSSVSNTGRYNGSFDCEPSIKAMQQGLRKYGLYPLKPLAPTK